MRKSTCSSARASSVRIAEYCRKTREFENKNLYDNEDNTY